MFPEAIANLSARHAARLAATALAAIVMAMLAGAAWSGLGHVAGVKRAAADGLAALAVVPAVAYVVRVASALHAPELRHGR